MYFSQASTSVLAFDTVLHFHQQPLEAGYRREHFPLKPSKKKIWIKTKNKSTYRLISNEIFASLSFNEL